VVGEIDPDLVQHLDGEWVHAAGIRARAVDLVAVAVAVAEQAHGHLGAGRVVSADEENGVHGNRRKGEWGKKPAYFHDRTLSGVLSINNSRLRRNQHGPPGERLAPALLIHLHSPLQDDEEVGLHFSLLHQDLPLEHRLLAATPAELADLLVGELALDRGGRSSVSVDSCHGH
jgi:hypothetical protein